MKAALFYGNQDVRIEDIPEPKLKPGQAIVDIAWCGICGSDLHEYLIGPNAANPDVLHPLTGETLPQPMGHEFCGRVRNPSAESGLKDGDAVMVDPRILCRQCTNCQSGATYGCDKLGYHGYNTGGGFTEKAAVNEKMLHKLPDNISLEYAAVLEPMAVVVHGIKQAGVSGWKDKSILIVGGGPIGLALTIALKAFGAEQIIVSEPTAARRKQIGEFAKLTLDPRSENVAERCKQETAGVGVDVVFDCAGTPAAFESEFDAVRLNGLIMNLAVWEQPMVVPVMKFLYKHITIKAALVFDDQDFKDAIQMMGDGKFVGIEKLVTSRIKIEDVVEKGLKELIHNKDKHIKILVGSKA